MDDRIIKGKGGKEGRRGPRKRNSEEGGRGDVEEEKEEEEKEKGVGNKTKRLFGFSRIQRLSVCSPRLVSDGCYITEKKGAAESSACTRPVGQKQRGRQPADKSSVASAQLITHPATCSA